VHGPFLSLRHYLQGLDHVGLVLGYSALPGSSTTSTAPSCGACCAATGLDPAPRGPG